MGTVTFVASQIAAPGVKCCDIVLKVKRKKIFASLSQINGNFTETV